MLRDIHPVRDILPDKLEPGSDHFILHHAKEAKCPPVLVKSLLEVFPNQASQQDDDGRFPLHIALNSGHGSSVRILAEAHPAAMTRIDPVTGLLSMEQALLNIGDDGSLENVDAVYALFRADRSGLFASCRLMHGCRVEANAHTCWIDGCFYEPRSNTDVNFYEIL